MGSNRTPGTIDVSLSRELVESILLPPGVTRRAAIECLLRKAMNASFTVDRNLNVVHLGDRFRDKDGELRVAEPPPLDGKGNVLCRFRAKSKGRYTAFRYASVKSLLSMERI